MQQLGRLHPNLFPKVPTPEALADEFSSVLIAIGMHETTQREEILLTKRTMWVETHKGQISFPGGFWESHDATLVDTALREFNEEMGANPADVQILGGLEPVETHQGIRIFPWVGTMRFPYPFTVNPAEVEKVLFLPLERLMHDGLQPVSVRVGGLNVKSLGILAEGELVWGATAKMLSQLRSLLRGE